MITNRKKKAAKKAEPFIDTAKLNEAFARKAKPKMHGVNQGRSKAWRIAQAERDLTLSDDDNW